MKFCFWILYILLSKERKKHMFRAFFQSAARKSVEVKMRKVVNTAHMTLFSLSWPQCDDSLVGKTKSPSSPVISGCENKWSIRLSIWPFSKLLIPVKAAGGWSLSQHALGKRQVTLLNIVRNKPHKLEREAPADLSLSETHYDFELFCTCSVEVKCETVLTSYLIWSAALQRAQIWDTELQLEL